MNSGRDKNLIQLSHSKIQEIVRLALSDSRDQQLNLFGCMQLLMQFCLMRPANGTCTLMLSNISWNQDAQTVMLHADKFFRDGFPRRLYANPENPAACPVLMMALYALVIPVFRTGSALPRSDISNAPLFCAGSDDEWRFQMWFNSVLSRSLENGARASEVYRTEPQPIVHSAAVYLRNLIGGPNDIQVNLRAGWSNGAGDFYILPSLSADSFVGRTLTTIDFASERISALPPHFADDTELHVAGDRDAFWRRLFPTFDKMPEVMRRCLPFWIASIVHHRVWLRSVLPAGHVVLKSPLFAEGHVDRLASFVQLGYYRNLESGLVATGIPPAVVQLEASITHKLQELRTNPQMVDSSIDRAMQNIPRLAKEAIALKLSDPGCRHSATDIVLRVVTQLFRDLRTTIIAECTAEESAQTALASLSAPTAAALALPAVPPLRYMWGGTLHSVPEGFTLNSQSLLSMLGYWYWGDEANNIGPLKLLTASDLTLESDKMLLSRSRVVFKHLPQPEEGVSFLAGFNPLSQAVETAVREMYSKLNAHREKKMKVFARIRELSVFTVHGKILELEALSKSQNTE